MSTAAGNRGGLHIPSVYLQKTFDNPGKMCYCIKYHKAVMKTRPGESHPERSLYGAMALCAEPGGYHF